ncbi:MAG TPA: DUF1592 domain-containing protein [Vicinamibacterales bacterium]|jgi:hypothetical protein
MMKRVSGILVALAGGLALGFGLQASPAAQQASANSTTAPPAATASASAQGTMSPAAQKAVVQKYCVTCHNDAQMTGGLSLQQFDATKVDPSIAGLMVGKLKAHAMPPAGMPQPDNATRAAFIAALQAEAVGQKGSSKPSSASAAPPKMPSRTGPAKIVSFVHHGDVMSVAEQDKMVHAICTQCHIDAIKPGGLSFEHLHMADLPVKHPDIAENMIAKLQAGMMPKASAPVRPDQASINAFVASLESRIDKRAATHPDPGSRTFQRLNRVEYAASIRNLLGLSVDVSQWLPPDTMSHNFDNIADVQEMSPTLLQAYLDAADEISRLAVGDPHVVASAASYPASTTASQVEHVPGAPLGTRGGLSVLHVFPADGTYSFKALLFAVSTGGLFGSRLANQQIEISIDGQRVALLKVDPQMSESKPHGLELSTPPIEIKAGQHRVSAAFLKESDAANDDLMAPERYTLADLDIGDDFGVTEYPHLRILTITGPMHVTGVSNTISRDKIFVCRPITAGDELPCATRIVRKLATEAYRAPVSATELQPLMKFYQLGRQQGDFENGIRMALQAVLASPHFLFRLEPRPVTVKAAANYRIPDLALASRLSYFLWATPPDATLIKLAEQDRLHEPTVLEAQVKRMLQDPRAYALSTRFAAQWLRLEDVDKVRPDALMYPQYDATLARDMKTETEDFFNSIVTGDQNVLNLLTADYTYVNQDLANFYGIKGVAGPQFQKVSLDGTHRRGILGEGAIQVETSVAERSDPVLRGKWVLEVLLGQPPPPPPPNVDTNLDDSAKSVENGKPLSVRQRMEEHRANPFCASCHSVIDPIGLSMENFGPSGHWRIRDNGVDVDNSTTLYDGTKMVGLDGLVTAMMKHQDTFLTVFTENLMAYALGRQVEYFDMPTVRAVIDQAKRHGNHFSSYVMGIVQSDAFRMSRAGTLTADSADVHQNHAATKGH